MIGTILDELGERLWSHTSSQQFALQSDTEASCIDSRPDGTMIGNGHLTSLPS